MGELWVVMGVGGFMMGWEKGKRLAWGLGRWVGTGGRVRVKKVDRSIVPI